MDREWSLFPGFGAVVKPFVLVGVVFFFQAEDGIRDHAQSRGLGDVYKRQLFQNLNHLEKKIKGNLAQSIHTNKQQKQSSRIERNQSTPNVNVQQQPSKSSLQSSQLSSQLHLKDLLSHQDVITLNNNNFSNINNTNKAELHEASQKLLVHQQYRLQNNSLQNNQKFQEYDELNKEFKKMFKLNQNLSLIHI
eukprot:TRINITY_DN11319_c0_g1_i1.p2 TRINITY_DN11319_c0_g1~~TRINITY_DN11319_c0_g1_i1.p2  ORF type:complete len:192 (+),score=26.12 TRINITY_DN11319_c0_g1_i1:33-608(+)